MAYASNIITEFKTVLEYIDKMKSKYLQYGLFVVHTILVEPDGFRVVIVTL